MHLNPKRILLVGALVASLVFGACGSDDATNDTAGDDATTTTTTPAPATPSIEMKEYSFGVTGDLTAGTNTIALKNSGTEFHMVAFAKLKAGKTMDDARAAFASQDEKAGDAVFEETEGAAPEGFLGPGQAMTLTADGLFEGTYTMVCFFPTEGEGMPHVAKGMFAEVKVGPAPAKPPAAPTADAEYTVAEGKVTGPTTLKAGPVTFKATAGAGGPHEFLVIRAKKPGTTFADADKYFDTAFEAEGGPPKGAAANAPFVVIGDLFDYEGTRYLAATLEPGDYFVGCNTSGEDENGKSHDEVQKVVVT